MFRAYITCVLGPRRKAYIAELKGFLVHALKDAGSGVAHPIVAAWKQRTHFFEQAKHAAGRARKLVSVIFVRPQNGPKDIRSHPNVGKYVITTPGSFCDARVQGTY
jgi:hypothetical protein